MDEGCGQKMIYNNPSYLCFKDRKPNIEILHNTYKMYKYTKSLRDTLPSIGMNDKNTGGGYFGAQKIAQRRKGYNEFIPTYKKPIKSRE